MSDSDPACRLRIGERAVTKSGRVLYAFSHFYLPFYGLAPSDVFWAFDPFAWISAFVYEVDEAIEAGTEVEAAVERLDALRGYLNGRAVLDEAIERLFIDAREYYRFEHEVLRQHAAYGMDDLVAAAQRRSFDFRLMHRILAQRSDWGYREELFAWFRAFEMLMEIEDDASSVESDSEQGTFNIFVLARRLGSNDGQRFIENLCCQAETYVHAQGDQIPKVERGVVERVWTAYRSVVPGFRQH